MVNNELIDGLEFFSPKYDENDAVEPFFGKEQCDTCNSTVAGDRYKVECRDRETGAIIDLEVCTDCFPELCN